MKDSGIGRRLAGALVTIGGLGAVLLTSACGGHGNTRAAIAFQSRDPDLPGAIFRVYDNGCCRKQLTHPPGVGFFDSAPAWSPDGKRLAFIRVHASGPPHLYIAGPKGETLVPIRGHEFAGGGLSWSPDGQKILFSAGDGLRTINLSDGKTTLIVGRREAGDGAWSPDGRTIALATLDGLYLVDSDGSHRRRLSKVPASLYDASPAWSPDGKQLAYMQGRTLFFTGFRPRIRVIGAAGGRSRIVTTVASYTDTNVTWSPDGRRLAFTDFDRSAPGIYTVSAAGGDRRLLVKGITQDVSWSRPPPQP